MFTLVKEFNYKALVESLKETIEGRPEVSEFMEITLGGKPSVAALKDWWKQNDAGWPLATCISIAAQVDGLGESHASDKAYIEAFEQAMLNTEEEPLGTWKILVPKLINILWMQHYLHHNTMEYFFNVCAKGEYACRVPSSLAIWTLNDDRAFVVTNTLRRPFRIPSGGERYLVFDPTLWNSYRSVSSKEGLTKEELASLHRTVPGEWYLLFDPASGLYRTDEALTEEIRKTKGEKRKMEKLIAAYAPQSTDLKLYCTSGVANWIIGLRFDLWARLRSPRPPGTENWVC